MKKRIHVAVTTYDRAPLLTRLLLSLEQERERAPEFDVTLSVYDDGTPIHHVVWPSLIFNGARYHRFAENNGRKGYWRVVNTVMFDVRQETYDYFIMLPDDAEPVEDFFRKAVDLWEAIEDDRKATLNLLLDRGREGVACWTGIAPSRVTFGTPKNPVNLWLSNWVDLCFISSTALARALAFRIAPVHEHRWVQNPLASSGVGAQVSVRLFRRGFSMYQVTETLVHHGDHESRMNPQDRRDNPLRTREDS